MFKFLKNKISIFLATVMFLSCTACGSTEKSGAEENAVNVNFVLFSNTESETFSGLTSQWSIDSNTVQIDDTPLFSCTNSNMYYYDAIKGWDGNCKILTYERCRENITPTKKLEILSSNMLNFSAGKNYTLEFDGADRCTITDEKGEIHNLGKLKIPADDTSDNTTAYFAASTRIGSDVIIAYLVEDNEKTHTCIFKYARVSLKNDEIQWFSSEQIPSEFYAEAVTFYASCLFIGENMYFPADGHVTWLDTTSGKICSYDTDFGELSDKALPEMSRKKAVDRGDWEFAPRPAGSIGQTVFYRTGYSGIDNNTSSDVYLALTNNSLLGALELKYHNGTFELNIYDSSFSKTQTIDLSQFNIDSTYAVFPRTDIRL